MDHDYYLPKYNSTNYKKSSSDENYFVNEHSENTNKPALSISLIDNCSVEESNTECVANEFPLNAEMGGIDEQRDNIELQGNNENEIA